MGWFTYRFNHGFQIFSKKYRRYLNFWFSFGSLIGILGMFGSIIFLFINLTKLLFPSRINENQIEQPLLTPVVDIHYFFLKFVSTFLSVFSNRKKKDSRNKYSHRSINLLFYSIICKWSSS